MFIDVRILRISVGRAAIFRSAEAMGIQSVWLVAPKRCHMPKEARKDKVYNVPVRVMRCVPNYAFQRKGIY